MGRGRVARLLSTAVAWRLQRIACRSDLARVARLAGESRCAAEPEALDFLKLDSERRLRLGARPAFVPTPALLSTAGGEVLVSTEQDDPVVVGLRPFHSRGGRVVLVLLDPDLESRLHALRYPAGWTDTSPSHSLPPDRTPPGVLQLRCLGRRLELRSLKAIDTIPRLAVPDTGLAPPEVVAVRVHPGLGLREEEPIELSDAAYETKSSAGATIVTLLASPQLDAATTGPGLIEVEANVGGDRVSAFVPWSAVGYEPQISSDSLLASPSLQLIDLLVGLFHRRSFRASYDPDTHGVAVWPVGDRLQPDSVSVLDAGREITAWSARPGPALGRLILPLPSDIADEVLDVHITSRGEKESSRVFVPDPDGHHRPLYPSETGGPLASPGEGILDTLMIGTSPRFAVKPNGPTNVAAIRGLVVIPLRPSSVDPLFAFIRDIITIRYRTRVSRLWYLLALVLIVGIWMTQAYRPEVD
jgi:hypothetical protein